MKAPDRLWTKLSATLAGRAGFRKAKPPPFQPCGSLFRGFIFSIPTVAAIGMQPVKSIDPDAA